MARVCSHSLAGIEGSKPSRAVDVLLLTVLCVAQVEVSAVVRSLVQRSPAKCGVPEYDREESTLRLWAPAGGSVCL